MPIEALNNALTGLNTHQAALGVIANNIANANTEGYVRKVAQLESLVLDGRGAGVRIADIQRQVDENLLTERRRQLGELSQAHVVGDYYFQIQNLFGAPADNSSIAQTITKLGNAFEELANSPEDTSNARNVVRIGGSLAQTLNQHYQMLQGLRAQADQQIGETVEEINGLLDEIDTLNVQIVQSAHRRLESGDLRDKRDVAIDRLAGLIDIATFERSAGDVVIGTTGGKLLLDVDPAEILFTAANDLVSGIAYDPERVTPPGDEGVLSGILVNDFDRNDDITQELRRGELAGLVDLRDNIVPNLQAELDNLAHNLRDGLNAVHNLGVSFPPPNELSGARRFLNQVPFDPETTREQMPGPDVDPNAGFLDNERNADDIMFGGVGVSRFSVVHANPASNRGELVETATIDWDELRADSNDTLSLQDAIDEISNSLTGADAFFSIGALFIRTTDPNHGVVVDSPRNIFRTAAAAAADTLGGLGFIAAGNSETVDVLDDNGTIIGSVALADTDDFTAVARKFNRIAGVTARLQTEAQSGEVRVEITADNGTRLSFVDAGVPPAPPPPPGAPPPPPAALDIAQRLGLTDADGSTRTGLRNEATVPTAVSGRFARSDVPVGRMDGARTVSENAQFTLDVRDAAGVDTTVSVEFDPTVNSLRDIVGFINNALTAAGQGDFAEARLVERDGFRIEIANSTGRNVTVNRSFALADGAELLGFVDEKGVSIDDENRGLSHYFGLNDFFVDAGAFSTTESIEVNGKLVENAQFVAHARLENSLNTDAIPPVTVQAINAGDNTGATAITGFLQSDSAFDAAGELPDLTMPLSEYAARIISNNALNASINADETNFQENIVEELNLRIASISGVNLDEELSNLILFQNAFTASARVVTTTQQLLDELVDLVR